MGEAAENALAYFLNHSFTGYRPTRIRKRKKKLAAKKTVIFLTGKLYWAKVLGPATPKFNPEEGKAWTFEIEPNAAGLDALMANGLADRIKGKGFAIGQKGQHKDREPFIVLKKDERAKDGSPNDPIRVYDAENAPWDASKLIGNESIADVKVDIRDYGVGKKKGIYPVAIRVKEHVPYVASEFGGMDDDDTPAPTKGRKKSTVAEDFAD